MIFSAFAEARVGVVVVQIGIAPFLAGILVRQGCFCRICFLQFDAGCIFAAEGECVAPDKQLDRVAERSPGNYLNLGSGSKSHIQKMHAAGAFASNLHNDAAMANLEIVYSLHYKLIWFAKIRLYGHPRNTNN